MTQMSDRPPDGGGRGGTIRVALLTMFASALAGAGAVALSNLELPRLVPARDPVAPNAAKIKDGPAGGMRKYTRTVYADGRVVETRNGK